MKNKALRIGIFLLTIGLLLLQFGEMIILGQAGLMEKISSLLGETISVEFLGLITQLLGVTLIVTGFVLAVDGVITTKIEDEIRGIEYRILAGVEEKINKALAQHELNITHRIPQKTCKFCAAPLNADDIFCPSCGRSQQ